MSAETLYKNFDDERHGKLLKVQYINARSEQNKTDNVEELTQDNKLDVLIITVTWLHRKDNDMLVTRCLTPPGYRLIHQPRQSGRRGGGVAEV